MTIQEAVKKVIEIRGLEIFKNLKQFLAFLDDLSPECQKERKIIKNNFDEHILGLFVDDSRRINQRLYLIKSKLDDVGLTSDWIEFILESFGFALGWEEEVKSLKVNAPISTNAPKVNPQQEVNTNIQDVVLNNKVLEQLGISDTHKKSLTTLDIPSTYKTFIGTIYRIIKIDNEVFKDCDKLQSVTIPDTVTEIGESAFENCRSLEKINIPESLTKLGNRAFANCKSLANITLPNDIIEIGNGAFGGCFSLNTAVVPNRVTKISEGLFGKCKSLVNITIPNGVTEICDLAFAGCEVLSGLFIPKTVIKIGSKAFANCKSLDSIIIPNTVTDIGAEAFGGCSKLQQFTLPTKYTIFKDDVNKQVDLTSKGKVQNTQIQSPPPPEPKPIPKPVQQTESPFKNAKVGDYIKFGNYPQTAVGGILPIEWQVLAIENNKILVISRYGLDANRFDGGSNNWRNSEIRKWLNGDFYNKAFTDQEKKYINLSNLSDLGTTDNVFLLSKEEAEKYFANDNVRRCKATDYAKKNGAWVSSGGFLFGGEHSKGYSWWWLRSPCPALSGLGYRVNNVGFISDFYFFDNAGVVVRPALSINL